LLPSVLAAAKELAGITNALAEEWQSHIDLLVEPKGLRVGLSKGSIMVFRRDFNYPGLSLLGNPINLAACLQGAANANQLVCSNQVYKDFEQSGLGAEFSLYKDHNSDPFVAAKNFGPVKAWVLGLA
jgi:class 3 adenylate cyclase